MEVAKTSKFFLVALGFIFALLLGSIRYLTGPEWALSLFYLLPICVVTWYVGRWAGVFVSTIGALSWLAADLVMEHDFAHCLVPCLNEFFRLIVFLFVVFTLSKLNKNLDKQKELALTDSLTGIANRRAFFKLANIEINRANRFKRPFSVAYMDLDNFKVINDRFGHNTGDFLLSEVARTIKDNIRAFDIVARLGGDEFILLLPETGADAACIVARRVQDKLLGLMQENKWPVTVSIGVVIFSSPVNNVDEIIRNADLLMYSVKQSGKNMIEYKVMDDSV